MSESMNEKIKKLLRLAERAGTPHEAEVARERAMRLMTKWGIEAAMLGDLEAKPEQIVTKMTAPFPAMLIKARHHIAASVVRGMGNMKVWISGSYIVVMGFESDVDRALLLIPSVLIQADNDVNKWWSEYRKTTNLTAAEARRAKRNFMFGFGTVVQHRLEVMNREEVAETTDAKSTALVLVDRGAQVDAKFQEEMSGRLRPGRGLKGSLHGGAAGRAAGERARLGGDAIGGGSRGALGG